MASFDDVNVLGRQPKKTDDNPELAVAIDTFMRQFEDLNAYYIQKVAEQIAVIGEMNPSSVNRMAIMVQMNEDVADIRTRLQKAIGKSGEQLRKILELAQNTIKGSSGIERLLTDRPLSSSAKARMSQLFKSIYRQTMGTMWNLSQTTAISQSYIRVVDQAILAVTTGLSSYSERVQEAVRQAGAGIRITYQSGYTRRLDSAMRSNVVTACNQIAQQGSDIVSEDLKLEYREITVHANPAPDHAPVQGRVFSLAQFQLMQSGKPCRDIKGRKYDGFRRQIGQWNCMHMAMGFDPEVQEPKYTDKQLQEILGKNEKGFWWRGKHYTMYQGTQMQRQLETEVRKQMELGIAAKAAEDKALQEECQAKIDNLVDTYYSLCEASGLKPKLDRMRVPGYCDFRRQNIKTDCSQNTENANVE